jgi:glycosyltransferase involved in cell wall biosynthesis
MIDNTANPRKKAVLVTDRYWPAVGGVEHWAHAVSVLLPPGFSVTIVALANNSRSAAFLGATLRATGFTPYSDEAGHPVVSLQPSIAGRLTMLPLLLWYAPFMRRLFPRPLFDFLYRFFKAAYYKPLDALLFDADIVHCFSTSYLAVCVTDVCRRRGVPLFHAPSVHFGKWGDSELLLRSYSQATVLLCQTKHTRACFLKLFPSSAPNIQISIPPLLTEPSAKQPGVSIVGPFILFLGRRERHKGLPLLLSAFGMLTFQATLVVAGPGEKIAPSTTMVVDLGVVPDFDKQWLLSNCSVFCVPSLDESFGIVYLEAMRCAKPIVALDVSPVNEIVVNNETGLLVAPN